ncbi:MAG: efflux RND transporter periplasmic adaptor subunit [Cyanobacteria bacterium SZAS-4]|nr:efflux RND transporter periplasmic adaptor subunit [Cyanobacteria bacterium SZAS-4]
MASMNKLSPILLIAISLFLAACNEAPKPPAMPPAAVAIEPVKVGPYQDKSLYLGTIKSRKSVTLSPNVEGNVTEIYVTAGQIVNPGQKIMKIDSLMQTAQTNAVAAQADSVQSDLSTAKATLKSLNSTLQSKQSQVEYTKTQHARYVKLCAEGAVSQSDLDNWKNNMSAAIADRDSTQEQIEAQKMTIQKFDRSHKQAISSWQAQREQLKYYSITAPFTGMVGDIPVKVGDHVTSSTALTTLTENHPLEVYISIPAEKASLMHQGMDVELVSTDGKDFGNSKVIFIAPTVDSSSQTVLVKTLYPNSKNELRADQAVRAQFVWQTTAGLSVPTKAVSQIGGKYFVFVAQKDGDKLIAKQAEIEVGEIEGSSYHVKNGLKPTDRIVTTGIQRLGDGAPIADKVEMAEKTETNEHGSKSTH